MVEQRNHLIVIKPHDVGWRERIFFLISGIIVSIPITLFLSALGQSFYDFLPLIYTQVISIVILAPIIEEFSKAYPLFYRYSLTERNLFILGFLVGLGFGITEFIIYVGIYGAPFYVRLPGLFFHAASTSLIAYGIARNKALQYYILAVFLHFGANLAAVIDQIIPVMVITFFTYFLSWLTYQKTTERYLEPK
ncbi:MAG: PrsW family intramembrane metalloprotease [Methanobacterium sp.]|nr:PrsW family intramembrane metalloprotease [Methanobacterium sp.]